MSMTGMIVTDDGRQAMVGDASGRLNIFDFESILVIME
jgi:hypothetical protein